ncbi:MAG: cupin domain-containing protein [Candidatus Bathyarchaeia archaeon]
MERIEGQVLRLADLVDYHEGSIVGRALIDRAAGSVTLFAFDEGQGISEHTVPYTAMAIILDGQAKIAIEGKPLNLTEGEMVIMPANKPHSVKVPKRFKMLLIMIRS